MNISEYMKVVHTCEKLKDATRHSFTSGGRHESVAEHSWRIAVMALFLKDEFPGADTDKVIRMCLLHDLGEAFTGDIPAFEKTAADSSKESDIVFDYVASLPYPYCEELTSLFQEMEQRETLEARIFKALDNLEAVIQHNEADISTWLPLEYDLQKTYGQDKVDFSPYMRALRNSILSDTEQKIQNERPPAITDIATDQY